MNFTQYIAIAKLLLALLPSMLDAVKALEEVKDAPGTGSDKLTLVIEILRSAYENVSTTVSFDALVPYIKKAVEAVLAFVRK